MQHLLPGAGLLSAVGSFEGNLLMARKSGITAEVIRVLMEHASELEPMTDVEVEELVTVPLSSESIVRTTLHFLKNRGITDFVLVAGRRHFWVKDPRAVKQAIRERDEESEDVQFSKAAMQAVSRLGHKLVRNGFMCPVFGYPATAAVER